MTIPAGLVRFNSLADVPCHWGRLGALGTRGLVGVFKLQLEAAFDEIWELCPYGRAEGILSLGAFVDRPVTPGDRHSTGTAFDLAGIFWHIHTPVLASHALTDPVRYLAVEASLRRHVAQSLDWWTNSDHHSHWHLDDREEARGFQKKSEADVKFVQAVVTHIFDRPVEIDGKWGPATEAAVQSWNGAPSFNDWLKVAAMAGWAKAV
jgi:hypothetical protein